MLLLEFQSFLIDGLVNTLLLSLAMIIGRHPVRHHLRGRPLAAVDPG